jgi:Tol biopolymer transport system component
MRRRWPVLWAAGIAFGLATCTSAAGPSVVSDAPADPGGSPASFGSGERGTIAFHADPSGRDDTYVMTVGDTDLTAVTDGMETIAQPYWSSDGQRLVVACCTSGFGHLFLVDAPGTEPVELAPDTPGAASPAWSPDGSRIAFESIDDGSLYLVDVTGPQPGAPRPLGVSGSAPSWSPDGGRIAYFAERDGNLDIATVAADGTDVEWLTRDRAQDYSPSWSPDGRRIAFVSERDGDQDVFVMDADGSNQIDVSADRWPDDFPTWSPDGRLIAYVAYRDGADPLTIGDGDAEIFIVAPDGSGRQDVTRNPAWDGDPTWSPDGSRIAFTCRTAHAEVYVMRRDGTGQRRLRGTPGVANDCCPAWRP